MKKQEPVWAIGLMSGTSLDGIDVALIRTDGVDVFERGAHMTVPFDDGFRALLHDAVHGGGNIPVVEQKVTQKHIEAVKALIKVAKIKPKDVRVIGFHGQTIFHKPEIGLTWQIGNGGMMAEQTQIDVVCDFRRRDVAAGGQGAPLVPLYHAALARKLPLPVAVLNIGGIANVTWIGVSEQTDEDILAYDIIAFDTGPGNAMLNDWVLQKTGAAYDKDGALAKAGKVHEEIVQHYMADKFFRSEPPKSLDRNYFSMGPVKALSTEDGAATLAEFAARSMAAAQDFFPVDVRQWLVTGGGRHNPVVMEALEKAINKAKKPDDRRTAIVAPVESVGWEGDALEAQAFAYLAVRSLYRLPISTPTTTGASRAVTGGGLYLA